MESTKQKLYKIDRCFKPKIETIETSDSETPIIKIEVDRKGDKHILSVIPTLSGISVVK